MIYRTCIGCVKAAAPCEHRDLLRGKLAGLSITSVKFKCAYRLAPFAPGDPVSVALYTNDDRAYWDGGVPNTATWDAVIIRVQGSKAIAFIDPDAMCQNGEYQFEPKNNGYIKRPLSAFTMREGERKTVCPICGGVDRHEDGWTCSMEPAGAQKKEFVF